MLKNLRTLNGRKFHSLINVQNVGLALVCVYILTTFIASDVGISSKLKSIALVLMLGWALISVLLSWKRKEFPLSGYTVWYLVFALFSFVGVLYSPNENFMEGAFYLVMVTFCVTFAITTFVNTKFSFKIFGYVYVVSAVMLVGMLYLKGMLSGTSTDRLGQDFMGNANTFAWMMMLATMFAMWLLVYESRNDSFKLKFLNKLYLLVKLALVGAIFVCLYALILSGGRKFFVLPFLFLYILLVLRKDKRGKTHFRLYTIVAIVFIAVAYVLIMNVEVFYNAIGVRIEKFISGLLEGGDTGASAEIRKQMREYAFEMWAGSPIFGYGFDSFKYYNVSLSGHFYYSHCNYTELLFSGGIILFVVYYGFIIYILKKAFCAKNIDCKYRAFSIATIICTLLFDFLGISLNVTIMHTFIALAYGVLKFNEKQPLIQ